MDAIFANYPHGGVIYKLWKIYHVRIQFRDAANLADIYIKDFGVENTENFSENKEERIE